MYVHTIRSGSQKQYVKKLLRIGVRKGRVVKNHTFCNLSRWDEGAIQRLESLLKDRRQCKDGSLLRALEFQLANLLLANLPISAHWVLSQLTESSGNVRLH